MTLRLALGQIAARVGDIDGNVAKVLDVWQRAAETGADLVVFTELTIPGYPPEDLLLKREFVNANLAALDHLAKHGPVHSAAVVGYVGAGRGDATDAGHWDVALATRNLTNSAAVIANNRVVAHYDKLRLPNYGVFDEARYFMPADTPCVIDIADERVGITICEDLWTEAGPMQRAADRGARVLVSLNASPYHRGKRAEREAWVRHHATRANAWVAYCNVVGGHDEVVFDGDSMVAAPNGDIVARGAQFDEDLLILDVTADPDRTAVNPGHDHHVSATVVGWPDRRPRLDPLQVRPRLDDVEEVWRALVRATRDYCHGNGFTDAIVGLSGGIDSAVTAAVAVDALGREHVLGVAMPSPYSSQHSVDDALSLAHNLGCDITTLPVESLLTAASNTLGSLVVTGFDQAEAQPGLAYENLQARVRGVLLMALSNERGAVVLTTGNKSEYAVGYATLYGDMAGGFAPLKDVAKTLVYTLATWRNQHGIVIPQSSIDKPPSAELRPGQLDQDSLPDYEVLDGIIAAYVERDDDIATIVSAGYDQTTVEGVLEMIDRAEYKRRQAAPGPKITTRAFGRDRRMPITNGWTNRQT